MKKINVAVIGCGNMGQHHCRNYFESKKTNLVSISDLDVECGKAMALKYKCDYYNNFIEMLVNETIDAVSICVPTSKHEGIVRGVLLFKKHILLEKPIAGNIKDSKAIINACKKRGVKLQIGHIERFNPAIKKLKKLMDNEYFGEVISLIIKRTGPFPPQIKDADILVDVGVHDVDIASYLLGKKPKKFSIKDKKTIIEDRADYAEIHAEYGKTSVFIQMSWITPIKVRSLALLGTKGYAELDFITQELITYKSKYKKSLNSFAQFVEFEKANPIKQKIRIQEPLMLEIDSFIDSIQNNKPVRVTGEEGLEALRWLLK